MNKDTYFNILLQMDNINDIMSMSIMSKIVNNVIHTKEFWQQYFHLHGDLTEVQDTKNILNCLTTKSIKNNTTKLSFYFNKEEFEDINKIFKLHPNLHNAINLNIMYDVEGKRYNLLGTYNQQAVLHKIMSYKDMELFLMYTYYKYEDKLFTHTLNFLEDCK